MNICAKCVYYRLNPLYAPVCSYKATSAIDPVSGNEYWVGDLKDCHWERASNNPNACGADGKWFEKKGWF